MRSAATVAPRLAGQPYNLTITRLVAGGSRVRAGDVLVEFDRQDQVRAAIDRRAEFLDLEQQILKKKADQEAALASDQTALTVADHDVGRARLEVEKNQFLARIDAEKNDLALEQATARLAQLRQALALKARSAAADIRILEIRRDRAERAWRNAETNADVMIGRAPFDGLAMLRSTYRGNQMARVQEGDEIYAGTPVVDVVDPARMQVRVRINQVDGGAVRAGQPATIRLDAYPDLVFEGRVEQVAPLAASSQLTPRVQARSRRSSPSTAPTRTSCPTSRPRSTSSSNASTTCWCCRAPRWRSTATARRSRCAAAGAAGGRRSRWAPPARTPS